MESKSKEKIIHTYRISSGRGPKECQLAAALFLQAIKKEVSDFTLVEIVSGDGEGCIKSAAFSCTNNLDSITGSIEWICKSPFRPFHRRKNWFIDFSTASTFSENENPEKEGGGKIKFEHFRSGGNGGQNVNKVETAVRLTDTKSGLSVTARSQRSQYLNRKEAEKKLQDLLKEKYSMIKSREKNDSWEKIEKLERGNPKRIYSGMDFKLIKK